MAAAEPERPASRIEAEVVRARGLLKAQQFLQALAIAQGLLGEVPENRDVLYLAAVSQRYLGRVADALRTLARCEELHPEYGRLFQERGHCYRAVGETDAAIEAYRQAVAMHGALRASWTALAELCRATGKIAEAQNAEHQAQKVAQLPPAVIAATNLLAEGDLYGAERIVRGFLQTHGHHIEAMRLLAQIGLKLDVLDEAEFLLESVLVFVPDYHAARYDYALVLAQRHKHARSLAEAETLLKVDPANRAFRTVYANAHVGLGSHEEALRVFRELAAETPDSPDLHLSIAHALKTLGRQPEAIESYRRAAAVRPSFGDAYWSLANLKTYRFADEEISRMRAQIAANSSTLADRYHLCFALGKGLEDRAEYEESFRYYERGNALKRSESPYDMGKLERSVRKQIEVCSGEFFTARQRYGCDRTDPIFIVGLPRAGSTLLEQILASHSQVEGTMELADIPRLVKQLNGRHNEVRYPQVLADLTPERARRLGEKFIADTQIYRTGKRFFIDKMPNNFRHIGLIHMILPNAKIIDARREPMACCFGNFKQLFAAGQEFTYDLEDIARYYRAYLELMAHWDTVLPGKILRIQHEDVVADLEGNVRRILAFCGLDFELQCVEFHKTERSVRTASSEQVRRPIFREGLDQWRHYEPWLRPLRTALGPYADSVHPAAVRAASAG
ncbi:MAG: tetratricopeptide repeat-containing sulfotransferase family protein [Steroidobacteraceae bacterium]